MDTCYSIAIDGPCGSGKSTVARRLSQALRFLYLDTGAMYRAVGLFMLRNGVALDDEEEIAARVDDAKIRIEYQNGAQRVFLAEEDVTLAIREPVISNAASRVGAVEKVRHRMVELQRIIACGQSVVMDGRDIGTCVLPNATLKIYLTASDEVRAARRYEEQRAKGILQPFEKVIEEIRKRDYEDMHRAASPLIKAPNAVVIDTSRMTIDEVVARARALFEDKIGRNEP